MGLLRNLLSAVFPFQQFRDLPQRMGIGGYLLFYPVPFQFAEIILYACYQFHLAAFSGNKDTCRSVLPAYNRYAAPLSFPSLYLSLLLDPQSARMSGIPALPCPAVAYR